MATRVEFVDWVQGKGDAGRIPRFLLLRDEEYWLPVSVVLRATLRRELSVNAGIDHDNVPEIDSALLRFGVRRIEQGVRDGIFPSEVTSDVFPLYVEEFDLSLLESQGQSRVRIAASS